MEVALYLPHCRASAEQGLGPPEMLRWGDKLLIRLRENLALFRGTAHETSGSPKCEGGTLIHTTAPGPQQAAVHH